MKQPSRTTPTPACPSCGQADMNFFYEVASAPVHSVLLMPTREEALSYPKGEIKLAFCRRCGFIWNSVFDPAVHEYSARYEETQGFSSTFSTFHKALAQRLVDQYDLHNKTLIEIGCGKGEFLTMLCEMGNNRGIGFDPAYISDRNTSPAKDRMTFITDLYSEKYSHYHGDFVCCKMTLEHILYTADFMRTVRRSIGDRLDTIVFFQIPDVKRILHERAFWDIYYEHCSYFSQGSLARLFRSCGFDVVDLDTEYDDQYLMIEARPGTGTGTPPLPQENDLEEIGRLVVEFTNAIAETTSQWKTRLADIKRKGQRAVLWGAGSKGVAFLTKLNVRDEVKYCVDINPYKHGTYMAGTGQEIVPPQFLKEYKPDIVIVMNPIYCSEIQSDLNKLGLAPELVPIFQEDQNKSGSR